MKLIAGVCMLCLGVSVQAQEPETYQELRGTIETFFEGFHEKDSLVMKSVTSDEMVMQSIGKDADGETVLEEVDFHEFLRSIVEIPAESTFREELHSFEVRAEGDMATVWTPYSLFMDGVLSHCGVNSFQLMKETEGWKIIYLVDTRSKEDCEDQE